MTAIILFDLEYSPHDKEAELFVPLSDKAQLEPDRYQLELYFIDTGHNTLESGHQLEHIFPLMTY